LRRAVARGRILPQSLSTDPRYGRLSLKAQVLYPLMWINCDDQGRLSGDPDEIKYATCPSVREVTAEEIPALLQEMETRNLIKVYTTSRTEATQMLDWWEVQRLQWASPSEYPSAEGWTDHLRYHLTPKEIRTENWPPTGLPSALGGGLPSNLQSEVSQVSTKESSGEPSGESSGETTEIPPLTTPLKRKEERRGRGRGRGNLPSALPSTLGSTSPSPTADIQIITRYLIKSFRHEWGRVPAEAPDTVVERVPNAKETAQLRDLGKELSTRGGVPLDYIKQAFGEAAVAKKFHISYVRAILLDWLGVERNRSP